MPNLNTTASGFFRFPARMGCRPLRVVQVERIECHASRVMFRHRHTDEEPVKALPPVTTAGVTPSRVPGARITVRV